MALLERQPLQRNGDTEALIREARRFRRRRWIIGLCIVVAAAVGVVVGIQGQRSTPPPGLAHPSVAPLAAAALRPLVNKEAFSSQGQLAFVSRNTLWVLDGDAQSLHQVELPKGLVPTTPTFSHDGRWLAFIAGSASQSAVSAVESLWIARSNGIDVHRVGELVEGDAFGWSPQSDLYAVAAGPISHRFPFYQPTTIRLISPSGSTRTLVTASGIVGAAWSPSGRQLAVSTMNHNDVSSLVSYAIANDGRIVWNGAPTARGDWLVPVGWWNQWGVVYTVIDNGMVPGGEGSFNDSALYALGSPDGTSRFLGETLTNDSDGAPTATTNGILAFVSNAPGAFARSPMDGKQVELCVSPSSPCTAAPKPAGDVSIDPSWSPTGSVLAYVTGPGGDNYVAGPPVAAWYDSLTLQTYEVNTATASEVASVRGAASPVWSTNGRGLLYVSQNGLWLLPHLTAQPQQVSSPIFAQSNLPNSYYGEVDWSQQFAWSAGSAITPCYVGCGPQL